VAWRVKKKERKKRKTLIRLSARTFLKLFLSAIYVVEKLFVKKREKDR
jgi:hypothetical protein